MAIKNEAKRSREKVDGNFEWRFVAPSTGPQNGPVGTRFLTHKKGRVPKSGFQLPCRATSVEKRVSLVCNHRVVLLSMHLCVAFWNCICIPHLAKNSVVMHK